MTNDELDAARGAMQARCRECDVPLDSVTPHEKGCDYPRREMEMMRPMTPEELSAHWDRMGGIGNVHKFATKENSD